MIAAALSIICLSCSANVVSAAPTAESGASERFHGNSIRIAQNRRPGRRNGRDILVEGCGVRDALCVANRLLRQMERQVGGQRRRQIDELGKLMQRACGDRPKDVVCAGDFVSQGIEITTGSGRPGPIVRERRPRSLPGMRLHCLPAGGHPGYFPARKTDDRRFGSRGFRTLDGRNGCLRSVRNWNNRYQIVCTNHGNRIVAQNTRDAFGYGWGLQNLEDCIRTVQGISRGGICIFDRGSGFRIMDIGTRSARGRYFRTLDRCLETLNWR